MSFQVQARGVVALLGLPNVGKSTLLNQLVGRKLAATTHKAQTTRSTLYHQVGEGEKALVFVDTPGLFSPNVSRALYQMAWGAVQDADILLLLCDGRGSVIDTSAVKKLQHWEKPVAIAINKIDLAKEAQVFSQTQQWQKFLPQAEIFQISAKRGTGLEYLKEELLKPLPRARTLSLDGLDDSFQAAELTREKVLLHIHDELPWQARIETSKIKPVKDGLRIDQVIFVSSERHRAIFIGKGGEKLKTIGTAAREDMRIYFKKKVHLFIKVQVDGMAR